MERNRAARGAKNAARALAFGATLFQAPVLPAFSQPPQTIERTAAQKLFDEIKDENLQKGTERTMRWADTLPFEIFISHIEPLDRAVPGRWVDLRGGDLLSVTGPSMGRGDVLMSNIKRYAKETGIKKLRVCVTHTHLSEYLRRIKNGNMSRDERVQLRRLGLIKNVPASEDSRGYTDVFDADGLFGTPPSIRDLKAYKEFLPGMEQSAYDEDIELEVVSSVTTAFGVWYYRTCDEGECPPPSVEFSSKKEAARDATVSALQAQFALYVNKEKPTAAQILESEVYKSVVAGYQEHGFKVWFLPKEMVPRLKNCKGDIE